MWHYIDVCSAIPEFILIIQKEGERHERSIQVLYDGTAPEPDLHRPLPHPVLRTGTCGQAVRAGAQRRQFHRKNQPFSNIFPMISVDFFLPEW